MYSRIGSRLVSTRPVPNRVNYLPNAAVRFIPPVEFQSRVWTVSPSREERLPHSPVAVPPAVRPLSPGVDDLRDQRTRAIQSTSNRVYLRSSNANGDVLRKR